MKTKKYHYKVIEASVCMFYIPVLMQIEMQMWVLEEYI